MITSTVVRPNRPLRVLLALILLLPVAGIEPLPARLASAETPVFQTESRRLFGRIGLTESVAFGDMDGDGHLDIVTASYDRNAVYLNDGQGNYADYTRCEQTALVRCFAPTSALTSVALGDLDGDGDLDIAATMIVSLRGDSREGELLIGLFFNDGGSFPLAPSRALPFADSHVIHAADGVPTGDRRIALGDLNGDGRLDVVAGSAHPLSNVRDEGAIYLNGPAGIPQTPSATFAPAMSVALGDLNGDDRLDLAVVDPWGTAGST